MKKKLCGSSGLELPVLGIGCWSFGGGKYWGSQDQNDVDRVVHRALDWGCNFFDTAEGYNNGESEISLGKALKGRRSEAIIGSKISPSNAYPDSIKEHCEASLNRLGTDYIDVYMMHWPINRQPVKGKAPPPSTDEAFNTLDELRREGKIRHVGLSNFGVEQLGEVISTGVQISVNELAYSLLSRAIEIEIMPLCRENGMGILGYMPLMQGLLTGKFRTPDDVPANRARTRHFGGNWEGSRHGESGAERTTFDTLDLIREISLRENISITRLSLAWSMANPAITCTITGARNKEQLDENAKAALYNMKPELVTELDETTKRLKEELGPSADYFNSTDKSRIR